MKKWKKPLLFVLLLLPFAAAGGYFVAGYQLEILDPLVVSQVEAQLGSLGLLTVVTMLQALGYAVVCGFLGYILAEKTGLMKPLRLERKPMAVTLVLSLVGGILFSLDYWTFGAVMPELRGTAEGITLNNWLGSVLYGGVMEEVMLRLFLMSLLAWLLWKLFFRSRESPPKGVLTWANVLAALLFAAGHLPATAAVFGTLTPLLLVRCFLLNGAFGLLFGSLYRRYGIQYAMLSHGLLHIVSKLIWTIFL